MLHNILQSYLKIFPEETKDFGLLESQLNDGEVMNDRRNFRGHITGSGIVLSPDRSKILLIHHKSFKRWQQPGGHWESNEEANPLEAARRESEEETSVKIASYVALDPTNEIVPLDIDSHSVAARPHKDEPEHVHHDFRYVFVAASEALNHQVEEVNDARWFELDAPETEFVRKIVDKLHRLKIVQA